MDKQLGLKGEEYSIMMTVINIPFVLLEPVQTMMVKRYGGRRVIPCLLFGWYVVFHLYEFCNLTDDVILQGHCIALSSHCQELCGHSRMSYSHRLLSIRLLLRLHLLPHALL